MEGLVPARAIGSLNPSLGAFLPPDSQKQVSAQPPAYLFLFIIAMLS